MLSKHPDKCRFPHGHTRKVEFELEADDLDGNEMVCDFKIIKAVIGEFLESLDHAMCMNTDDPAFSEFKSRYGDRVIGFVSKDPTTEILARTIFEETNERLSRYRSEKQPAYALRESVELVRVRVWETASSWAEYRSK